MVSIGSEEGCHKEDDEIFGNLTWLEHQTEEIEVEPATETRKAKVKTIRYEMLTEAGLAYDPVAEEAAKQAAKEAAKAEKEAAKAAK